VLAAVIESASSSPTPAEVPEPVPAAGEVVGRVLAAGLHQLVRAHAANRHYSSHGRYPMAPGIDGVAELPDGRRVYFAWPKGPYGSFAERIAISPDRAIELPVGVLPEVAAAIVNPAMSGWLALRLRAPIAPDQTVVVLGATGTSGKLAVQVARALGAKRIVAAGRNASALASLGADETLKIDADDFGARLDAELADRGVDIVLDYLWGGVAERTLAGINAARERYTTQRIRYVNIGQSAGDKIAFSPHALRSTKLELIGSGLGSVTPAEMAAEIPALLAAVAAGQLTIELERYPLARVGEAWAATDAGRRAVIVP
jgi:NADPH:quinone reductase-like Zn-dependent oxidoreductase